jgi:hypothetical protein
MSKTLWQSFRYIAAVVFSPFIGEIVGFPFALALDILWGHEVTGGTWALTFPNVLLTIVKAIATGFSAGWIAGRRGKLVAVLANFFILVVLLVTAIVLNRDIIGAMPTETKPALWVWIGLIPALLAGHFAVKYRHLGIMPVLFVCGGAMSVIAQFGAAAFHVYTVIIAYEMNGFVGAFLTLLLPGFSQIWYAWHIWGMTGTFWNVYTMRFALLIVWGVMTIVFLAYANHLEEKKPAISKTIA